eukprot:2785564-Pleurochrysis_carterae.AAC.1
MTGGLAENSQVLAILGRIAFMPVQRMEHKQYYKYLGMEKKEKTMTPLLDFDDTSKFHRCVIFANEVIDDVRKKIRDYVKDTRRRSQEALLFTFTPQEMVALEYAIQVYENGKFATTKIDVLYDVMNQYMGSSPQPSSRPLKIHYNNLEALATLFQE